MRLGILVTLLAGSVAAVALGADDLAAVKDSAVRLYDQGNYDEARARLKQLDDARTLDGPLLYRLFFCEKATGHDDDASKALDRARAALESQIPAGRSLEDSFYLANTYTNLGRTEDARKVAHDATTKLESGGTGAPTTPMGQFQLGKLYQDQGRQAEASKAYAKAVESFDVSEGRYAGNLRRALRYLASGSYERGDFAAAESSLARLTAFGGAETADWDTLAASRARLGKFAQAAEAWRAQVKLDPANADDPRYSARLAEAAAALHPLPAAAGGAAFTAMSRPDLEAFLKARSQDEIAVQARAAEAMKPDKEGGQKRSLDPKLRVELAQALTDTRRQFVAAGLEYALRRYGIRETAFREGYAVLIFQDRAWELPPDPEGTAAQAPAGGS